MSEKNKDNFFFQISKDKITKNSNNNNNNNNNNNESISLDDIQKYHNRNSISKLFHKSKYNKLRDSIRQFAKKVNTSFDDYMNEYKCNPIYTFSEQLSNLRKATLVLRGVDSDNIPKILEQGRLSILATNTNLKGIEENYKWGYKTKQIVLSKDNKITTKRGNSYIEPCLFNDKQNWKKLRKSGTWKLLYNLETKIIKSFGENLIKNSKTPENESDTLVFSKDEPGIKENKIPENKSSTFTFSSDEPGIKENKIPENKSSTFTFSSDEPGIDKNYFMLIKEDNKLSDDGKISKVSEALNSILDKILLALKNILNNKNSENELEYIKKFYFNILGYQQYNSETLGYFNYIIDIINSIDNSEKNILSKMSVLSENIEKKGTEILKFSSTENKKNKSFSSKDITYDAKLDKVITLIKNRFVSIYKSLDDKINEIKNNKTSKKK